MQDYLYSVIGFIAIIIQLIINFNVIFKSEQTSIQKAGTKYRLLMISIFVYYITDTLWGILAGLNWIPLLFVDTTIYYIAMSLAIVCFYRYIVEYLEYKDWRARFFNIIGISFFVVENISLVINFFYPCFFWFDENDAYVAGTIRYIALWIQVGMFGISSIATFIEAIRTEGVKKKRHSAIFFFSLIMLIAILFQEKYPLLPFYAVGCLIGSCVLHVYVVGDELEEYRVSLNAEKQKLMDSADQLSNYKRAVLADASVSLEVNLTKDELYYGVWKGDDGGEVPLKQIIGLDMPCSYDCYIERLSNRFVKSGDAGTYTNQIDREYLLQSFESGTTEITFDYEGRTISGHDTWLRRSIAMIRNQSGDVIAFTSVKDITAQVEQTRREEGFIRALATEYDSIAIVSIGESEDDAIVVNRARLTDSMAALIDDETVNELHYNRKLNLMLKFIHPDDREQFYINTRRKKVLASFAEDKTHIVDFRVMKKDGGYLYFQLHFVALRDETGKPTGTIAGMKNIDAEVRKDMENRRELVNAKIAAEAANNAKSTFLFNMSHDIRTPMNAILGFTDMAEKYIDDRERVLDSLHKVKLSGNHLLSLVNDVLDMSRIESGSQKTEEEVICIDACRDNLYSLMNSSALAQNIVFTSQVDDSVVHHWIYADRLRIMRVLTNTVSNSVKYTNPGGKIDLTIEELPCDREGCARFCYTVTDTGIGMSKEFLEHIFEPFSRAESATKSGVGGTGLGMAITKSLVELMGGTITIESEPDVGTTVRMEFENRIAEPIDPLADVPDIAELHLEGKKILLVEDNDLNREIATDILEEEGIAVESAEDGDIAVEKMRTAQPGQYDLILMDIQMPRMNGYDATRAIRALPGDYARAIPIVAMTANAFDEDKKNALAAGMNGHLAKPIDVPKLMSTLSEILSK